MSNRFRTAIKGTSKEILSTGKQEETEQIPKEENEASKPINRFVRVAQDKNLEAKEPIIQAQPEENTNYEQEKNNGDLINQQTTSGIRKVLQNMTAKDIEIKEEKTFEAIVNFLNEKVNNTSQEIRFNKLKAIFNALLEYPNTGKTILLCDMKDNIAFWIEAVKLSVSPKIANTLVFKTYPNANNTDCANCSIFISETEENSIRRSHSEYDPSLCVFNLIRGTGSKIQLNSNFAEFVFQCYQQGEKSLLDFRSFAENFEYFKIDSEIENCSKLFQVINSGLTDMDCKGLDQAINFADKYANIEIKRLLLKKLDKSVTTEVNIALAVVKFIFNFGTENGDEAFYQRTYEFFFECIQNLLNNYTEDKISEVNNFYNEIVNYNAQKDSFVNFALSSDNINKLTNYIINKEAKYAKFYLAVINSLMEKKNISILENEVYTNFIDKCLDVMITNAGDIEGIVNSVCKNASQLVNFILLYYNKLRQVPYNKNEAIKLYIKRINDNHGSEGNTIRNLLFQSEDGKNIIIYEFKINLEKEKNKKAFFWEYNSKIFERISGFKEKCFSEVTKLYLGDIAKESYYKDECYKLITVAVKEPVIFSNEMVGYLIDEYVNELPLAKPDQLTERILNSLSKIKIERNIVCHTNIEELINFGLKLENVKNREALEQLIDHSLPNLTSVSLKKQEQFSNWCLNILSKNDNATVEEMINFYSKIKNLKEKISDSSTETLISVENVNNLITFLEKLNIKEVQFYVISILEFLTNSNHIWNDSGDYERFIKACMRVFETHKNEFKYILDYISDNTAYFSKVLILYTIVKSYDEDYLTKYFEIKCKEKGEKWANKICLYISENLKETKFLYQEYKARFKEKQDKTTFFWNYTEEIFNNSPDYKLQYFSEALEYYLSNIENENMYIDECFRVLEIVADEGLKLKSEVMSRIIKEYENVVPLNFPGDDIEEIIKEIQNMKITSGVVTKPDIIGIVIFGLKVTKEEKPEKIIKILKETNLDFKGIDKERYNEYIIWCLPMVCNKINVLENDTFIKRIFYIDEYKEEFLRIYNEIINEQLSIKSNGKSKSDLKKILSGVKENSIVIASILVDFYKQCQKKETSGEAVELFIDTINKKDDKQALDIRKDIYNMLEGENLLFNEYIYRLSKEIDKPLFFEKYSENVFEKMPDYTEKYYNQAMLKYIDEIKNLPSYADECYKLLNLIKKSNLKADNDILYLLISTYEKKLSMEQLDIITLSNIIENIKSIKEKNNIITEPDLTRLIDFEIKLSKLEDEDKIRKLIGSTYFNLNKISEGRYIKFLDWCLPKCVFSVNLWPIHARIKKLFYSETYKNIFFSKYIEIMDSEIGMDEQYKFDILSQFIIYFFNSEDNYGDSLRNDVIKNICGVLLKHTKINIKEVENSILAETSGMKNKNLIINEWNGILKLYSANEHEKGIFGKIFRK